MELAEKLRSRREALGLSQGKLAKLAGTSQQTIDRLERGLNSWSRSLEKILEILGLEHDGPSPTEAAPAYRQIKPRSDSEIPIYSITEIDGDNFGTTDIYAGSLPRPGTLHNVVGAYAIYMHGPKMAPVLKPGDLLVVNPHQPARPEDGAIFLSSKRDRLQVGELARENASEWIVKKYSPKPHEIALKKRDFPYCEAIHAVFKRR